jgi:hypothetical protein
MMGKVILNIKIDGLPSDCNESLLSKDFLIIQLIPEVLPVNPDINIRYIPTSKESFIIILDFNNDDSILPFMVLAGISSTTLNFPIFITIDAV